MLIRLCDARLVHSYPIIEQKELAEHLGKSELAKSVMGESMLRSFLAYKVDEWERYHQETTDWEVREYLRLY